MMFLPKSRFIELCSGSLLQLLHEKVDPGLSYFDTTAVIEADRIETSGVLQNGCLSDEICSAACLEHFLSWLVFTVHHAPPRKYYTATRLPPVPVSDM